jgi:hypothetical protein
MSESSFWERAADWFAYLPVRLAYRIIWVAARLNLGSARQVYAAMWEANLDLPALSTPPSEEGGR